MQNSSDDLLSYLRTNIIAQILSVRGEGLLFIGEQFVWIITKA